MDKNEYRTVTKFFWGKIFKSHSLVMVFILVVIALIILVLPIFNPAEGPIDTAQGSVLNIFVNGSSIMWKAPIERVQIMLPGGILVNSEVPPHLVVLQGDTVTVEVYRHRLTGSKDYHVVKVEK
ncbi:MAG: hypothetical protein ACYDBW_07745 [Sulfuricaulis sp.]